MDPIRVGRIVRALRQRQGWRQVDLARRAGVSQPVVSRLEAGHLKRLPVGTLEAIFEALGARCRLDVSWRGAELDRLLDDRHARMVGEVVRRLERVGWEAQVEVSYSVYGERGSIDVLAWHAAACALLVVEVKTELTSVEETLRKLDAKVRLAARPDLDRFSGRATMRGRLLVLPDSTTARRRAARAASVLEAALPMRGPALAEWLRRPVGGVAGLLFLPPICGEDGRWRPTTRMRVQRPSDRAAEETLSVDRACRRVAVSRSGPPRAGIRTDHPQGE
jgi:transcriptional regulator with XRE-family HTH domain